MAGVRAVAALPEALSQGEQLGSGALAELQQPGERRLLVGQPAGGLQDGDLRVALHYPRQPQQGVASHDAVGIEHRHIAVIGAEAATEGGDICGFAAAAGVGSGEVMQPAVEPVTAVLQLLTLGAGDGQIGAVAQQEKVEPLAAAGRRDRGVGGVHPGEHPLYVFVVNRHHHGDTGLWG